ncbi:amidase [Endozoicomonas sp. G2_2]|uniref:amidase n=1 Tax=Endozoicomonas sp. G2_2 TaxID=2821092 RepID=UPI001ADC1721|nr:amidase [Endozoicomonas sp. G2_2]MBO9470337.1 amidase [Endozoicomonas sp. G2_2]
MEYREYVRHDALGLARLVAERQVTAAELLDTARQRMAQVNPSLNAVIRRMDSQADAFAQAHAKNTDENGGAFAGVPFLLKDLFQDYAGVESSYGNAALKQAGFKPEAHAEITRRFIASGVNIFGKTNTPEFGAKGVTEPEAFGVTRNPWNTEHTPGGSSGGSAAAIAAGIVPMAGANDGGGSIRIPAACCGLFGLKPGRARVPGGPERSDMMHGASVDHVITRSVRDSAAMLDAVAGYEHGAIARLATPDTSYLEGMSTPPKGLRIGVLDESPLGIALHAEAHAAIKTTTKLLESLGHRVERAAPAIDGLQLGRDFLSMWFVQMTLAVDDIRARTGAKADAFEMDTRAMAHVGRAFSAQEYMQAFGRWQGYRHALAEFHAEYDLLLTPTLANPPSRIGESATPKWQLMALRPLLHLPSGRALIRSGIVEQIARENLRHVPFTQLANLTGVPAMSVPLHMTDNGLPLGSQFVGGPGSELLLLQLGAQLEQAAPWFDRLPELG